MDNLTQSLKARIPELFDKESLVDNVAVSVPVSLDGETTQICDVGIEVGRDHFMYDNGHVLCTAGDKLRWAGITVEERRSKYDFVADLTMRDGRLTVKRFQLNTFALGVKVLSENDAEDYLNEYMEEGNDWHHGYTISKDYSDKFHPSNAIQILDEGDPASARRLKVIYVPTPPMPKYLRQTEDSRLEQFSTTRGATIHGILWVKNARTEQQFYPMFVYHNLRVQKPTEFAGTATRVLCATFCDCHEPGGVNLAHSVDELREVSNQEAVFIAYSEDVVLHFFHKMTLDEHETYGKALDREPKIVLPN